MDKLENIILFVFILFSIISSIMKKKKQAEAKTKMKKPQAAKKPGLIDIFQEMAKEALPKEEKESEVDAYFLETQKEAKKLGAIAKAEQIQGKMGKESFSNFQKPTLIKPKETRFDYTYDNAENELNLKNQNLHKVRELLCNPKSLRDYVVMKEILDKPKALQEI